MKAKGKKNRGDICFILGKPKKVNGRMVAEIIDIVPTNVVKDELKKLS